MGFCIAYLEARGLLEVLKYRVWRSKKIRTMLVFKLRLEWVLVKVSKSTVVYSIKGFTLL